jgi:hypothetical protein
MGCSFPKTQYNYLPLLELKEIVNTQRFVQYELNLKGIIFRVRRSFSLQANWSETEAKFFRFKAKKVVFFAYFASKLNI